MLKLLELGFVVLDDDFVVEVDDDFVVVDDVRVDEDEEGPVRVMVLDATVVRVRMELDVVSRVAVVRPGIVIPLGRFVGHPTPICLA